MLIFADFRKILLSNALLLVQIYLELLLLLYFNRLNGLTWLGCSKSAKNGEKTLKMAKNGKIMLNFAYF